LSFPYCFYLLPRFAFSAANQKNLRACRIQKYLCEFELYGLPQTDQQQEVTVEADPDIFALTKISVENGVLMINVERKPDSPKQKHMVED